MTTSPRPEPVNPADRPQLPDPLNPLEDPMDTDPQPSFSPGTGGSDTARLFDAAEPTTAESTTAESTHPDRTRRPLRVGTVVWGLVIAAVGVGILALAAGLVFDVELALIFLVAAAGVALLVGSLITGIRRAGGR